MFSKEQTLFAALVILFAWPGKSQRVYFPDGPLPLNAKNGTFSSHLNSYPLAKESLQLIISHLNSIEDVVHTGDPKTGGPWLCEEKITKTVVSLDLAAYGTYARLCMFGIDGESLPSTLASPPALYNAVILLAETLEIVSPYVLSSYSVPWSSVHSTAVLSYDHDRYRKCSLSKVQAYKFDGSWGVSALLTNFSITKPAENRGLLKEIMSMKSGSLIKPVTLSLQKATRNDSHISYVWVSGTARVMPMHSTLSYTYYDGDSLDKSAAIQNAIQGSEVQKDLAEETDVFSSLAVLFLPTVLALLPISIFQDASMGLTIVYAFATDVISVLPVAIKGIELVTFGGKAEYGLRANVHGVKNTTYLFSTSVQVAKCEIKQFISRRGYILLFSAVGIMAIGLVLECASWFLIKSRKKKNVWEGSVTLEGHGLLKLITPKERRARSLRADTMPSSESRIVYAEIEVLLPVRGKEG